MTAPSLTHTYTPCFKFQVHYNYHCTTFTLTCSFSCLMDCWRVSIWLNKGLLSVLRKIVRFSLCWESLFSRSFACRRSRICSTCCLSAPESSTCEECSFISHRFIKVITFRLHTCSRIFRHIEGYFWIYSRITWMRFKKNIELISYVSEQNANRCTVNAHNNKTLS